MKEVATQGSKVLRVIDYMGDVGELKYLGGAFEELIHVSEYEYIDFYCYGVDEEILNKAGFVKKQFNDVNIIPNYFEPFVQQNIDINFATSEADNFYMFKGDGDQDRPNE